MCCEVGPRVDDERVPAGGTVGEVEGASAEVRPLLAGRLGGRAAERGTGSVTAHSEARRGSPGSAPARCRPPRRHLGRRRARPRSPLARHRGGRWPCARRRSRAPSGRSTNRAIATASSEHTIVNHTYRNPPEVPAAMNDSRLPMPAAVSVRVATDRRPRGERPMTRSTRVKVQGRGTTSTAPTWQPSPRPRSRKLGKNGGGGSCNRSPRSLGRRAGRSTK